MKYLHVRVPVSIIREGQRFVAYSPVLDLSTSGRTRQQVRARFAEVVEIFFEELEALGTTEEVLTGLGWQKVRREWRPPLPIFQDLQDLRIPISV